MTDQPSPIEAYKLAMQCYGVPNELLAVYDSNSYRRVGLEREYKVLVYADRMDDGQLNIEGQSILRAMVAAFNAMPEALKEIERLRVAAGFPQEALIDAFRAGAHYGDSDDYDPLDLADEASVFVEDRQFVSLNPAVRAECEAIMAEGAKVLAQHPEMVHATAEPPRVPPAAELPEFLPVEVKVGATSYAIGSRTTLVLDRIVQLSGRGADTGDGSVRQARDTPCDATIARCTAKAPFTGEQCCLDAGHSGPCAVR